MAQTYSYPTTHYVPNQNHPHPAYFSNHGTTVAPQPKYPAMTPSFSSGFNAGSHPEPIRKRPKYTRSKTGCLVCRRKKIKCDESKPSCQRCTHGQRECVWPDPEKKRKQGIRKKTLIEERPSTADSSSHFSDSSSNSYDYSESAMSLNAASPSATICDRRSSDAYGQPHQTHTSNANTPSSSRQSIPGKTVSYESNLSYNSIPDYSRYQYTYSPGLFGMYAPESCSQPTVASTSSRSITGMSWAPAQFRSPTNQLATTRSPSQYPLDRNIPPVYGPSADRHLYSY